VAGVAIDLNGHCSTFSSSVVNSLPQTDRRSIFIQPRAPCHSGSAQALPPLFQPPPAPTAMNTFAAAHGGKNSPTPRRFSLAPPRPPLFRLPIWWPAAGGPATGTFTAPPLPHRTIAPTPTHTPPASRPRSWSPLMPLAASSPAPVPAPTRGAAAGANAATITAVNAVAAVACRERSLAHHSRGPIGSSGSLRRCRPPRQRRHPRRWLRPHQGGVWGREKNTPQ